MDAEVQILLAILLYLAFFAWIGWRRGLRSELIVFFTALLSWVLLQERGNIFVRMTNMAVRFFGIFASALGGGETPADPAASNGAFIPEGAEDGFLFLAWIMLVFLAYLISSRPSVAGKSSHGAVAALVGVLNGYLFLAVLLPKFSQLYEMSGGAISEAPLQTFINLIVYTLQFIVEGLQSLWEWVQPLSPVTILILITLLLALVAITLRSSARAKG